MFTEAKLNQIRQGIKIRMKTIKYWAEIIKKQNTNTWLHIKTHDNSLINIRQLFRKLSLRVNRLIRISYGPFTLNDSKNPGDIYQVEIPRTVGNYVTEFRRHKMSDAVDKLNETKILVKQEKESFEQKLIDSAKVKLFKSNDHNKKLK